MLPVDFGLGVTGGHGAAASCGALGPLQLTQCVVRIYHFFIGHGTGEAERHRTQGSRWAKRPTRERRLPDFSLRGGVWIRCSVRPSQPPPCCGWSPWPASSIIDEEWRRPW